MDCLFCKIINKEILADIIYEDDKVLVFKDIKPQAPIHFLAVPKQHIDSVIKINSENSNIISYIFEIIAKLAKEYSLENGFRVITNHGVDGGQTVNHLHFHLLGKKIFDDKMWVTHLYLLNIVYLSYLYAKHENFLFFDGYKDFYTLELIKPKQ